MLIQVGGAASARRPAGHGGGGSPRPDGAKRLDTPPLPMPAGGRVARCILGPTSNVVHAGTRRRRVAAAGEGTQGSLTPPARTPSGRGRRTGPTHANGATARATPQPGATAGGWALGSILAAQHWPARHFNMCLPGVSRQATGAATRDPRTNPRQRGGSSWHPSLGTQCTPGHELLGSPRHSYMYLLKRAFLQIIPPSSSRCALLAGCSWP
jgi:hypothetical protein